MLTAKDVPAERLLGHIVHDWPVMIAEGEETHYVGDALVVLAAETREAARRALELIRVEYEELPPLLSPAAAMAEGAPRLHPKGAAMSTKPSPRQSMLSRSITRPRARSMHFSSRKARWRFRPKVARLRFIPPARECMTIIAASWRCWVCRMKKFE